MSISSIKFGTDGWRGIIADDFTFDNVALVGSAIQHYLNESGRENEPLLIGYDRRFAAEAYATHLANHMNALGRTVVLASEAWPTPVTAFGVKHLGAAGAVMLTASHNPHYYQGLKFIPWFAGPAMPETTDRLTALIQDLGAQWRAPALRTDWDGESVSLKDAYFKHLDSLVNSHSLSSIRQGVLYSPMFGVGAGYLDGYLHHVDCPVQTICTERDVYFGGKLPDPSPKNLLALVDKLADSRCALLIATDGDADRFGMLDPAGEYYGANHALPLLADYLLRFRGKSGRLIRTVSTSHLLDSLAAEYGLELVETAVGFKYVGAELLKGGLIGGEESGGISIQGHIPEKDGILSSLLLLEMLATTGEGLGELFAQLQRRHGPRNYQRIDEHIDNEEKLRLLAALRSHSEASFAERKIAARNLLDGVKFIFENGSWMLLRASGTEPLVRIYLESAGKDSIEKLRRDVLKALKVIRSSD